MQSGAMRSSSPKRAEQKILGALALAAAIGAAGCDKLGLGDGGVVQIAAGGDLTCALTRGGDVYCWGDDARALQRRDTSDLPPASRTVPEKVASLSNAAFIDVAGAYGCAVLKTGQLRCFSEAGLKPLELPAIEGVVRVSLAKFHGVIEKSDGTAANFVRPGKGDPTPQPIVGLTGAKRVMTGDLHGCALVEGGRVKCWGAPTTGATADAEPGEGNAPRALQSLAHVEMLSVGSGLNCAVDSAHAVWCWGSNSFGQAGQQGVGLAGPPLGKPTRVPFVTGATSVDAGVYHACAVLEGGTVTCWGSDEFGQLGHVQSGVAVPNLKDVVAVTVGEYHACALDKSGHVKCWGRNLRGALGNGSTIDSAVPVEVKIPH
jgi:alpha-tubulin suppressor-like RCC1 family protein